MKAGDQARWTRNNQIVTLKVEKMRGWLVLPKNFKNRESNYFFIHHEELVPHGPATP